MIEEDVNVWIASPPRPLEEESPELSSLLERQSNLVNDIRNFAKSQVGLWRQLPILARLARGIEGASRSTLAYYDECRYASCDGYWPLISQNNNLAVAFIDCATGEIADARNPDEPASNHLVLDVFKRPGQLHVEAMIRILSFQLKTFGIATDNLLLYERKSSRRGRLDTQINPETDDSSYG